MGKEREYVCVWKIRIDRTDIHFFHQAHSSLLPRYKWFCCAAVRLRSICTISLKIKRLTAQLSLADYTMPMRIKQTCLFSSNNSLRGYVRVRMIMLIAWLPKSKSTTPLCPHASVWSSQQIQGWFPSVWPERILAQQPQGIITTLSPATGAQLANSRAFHYHRHDAQDDIHTERAILRDQCVY